MADNNKPLDTKHVAITIGRQFGSGGRELGRKIAERLGVTYYDKELLAEVAQEEGISEQFVADNDERYPRYVSSALSFSMGFAPVTWYQTPSSISSDRIYGAQSDVIRRLAAAGSCVIVGRTSDYILRDHPRTVNIFVHAPLEACIGRIMHRQPGLNPKSARALAEKTNRLRANFYNFYTDKQWGDAASYDICFDTSVIPTDDIAGIVADYVRRRFPDME